MPSLVPVSSTRHGSKQLLPRTSWSFAAGQQATSLLVAEFPVAAMHFPIVFARLRETFNPAALLGLASGTNQLIDAEGRWSGEYIPAILRRHPFVLIRREEGSDEFVLCVDEDGGMLADSGGEPLFTADGQPAPALEKARKFAEEFLRNSAAGERLCALLSEHGLLVPLALRRKEENIRFDGIYIVDEKKFSALPDEAFLSIRAAGFLPAIYAQLFSLRQLDRLGK